MTTCEHPQHNQQDPKIVRMVGGMLRAAQGRWRDATTLENAHAQTKSRQIITPSTAYAANGCQWHVHALMEHRRLSADQEKGIQVTSKQKAKNGSLGQVAVSSTVDGSWDIINKLMLWV